MEEGRILNPRERKVKLDPNSEVWVHRVLERKIMPDGKIIKVMEWQKLKEPMSFGSIKHPLNTDVEAFEVRDSREALHHPQHRWFSGI